MSELRLLLSLGASGLRAWGAAGGAWCKGAAGRAWGAAGGTWGAAG